MYILAQENEKLQDKKIQVHLFKCQEKGGGGSSLEICILNNERVYTHRGNQRIKRFCLGRIIFEY